MSDNRTTIQDDMRGFLHRHPRMEMDLALDSNHAIVDMQDWKQARIQANGVQTRTERASHIADDVSTFTCSVCGCREKECIRHNSDWYCKRCGSICR